MTHICVGKLIIIGSDNGLSTNRRQAIIWPVAGLLSIGPLRTYFSEYLINIQQFSLKKMHVKMSSAKWRPFCLGLNVLIESVSTQIAKTLGSPSIWHRPDPSASDWYSIYRYIDPRVFEIWALHDEANMMEVYVVHTRIFFLCLVSDQYPFIELERENVLIDHPILVG